MCCTLCLIPFNLKVKFILFIFLQFGPFFGEYFYWLQSQYTRHDGERCNKATTKSDRARDMSSLMIQQFVNEFKNRNKTKTV